MKTEFTHISDCRRELTVEIPTETVDEAIARLSKSYGRSAKVPGFRPGKVPAHVILARFRDQILHDVAQDLVSKAVDEALASEDLTPVATPEIRDVDVNEGKPLTFRATFETLPVVEPGNYDGFTLRQTPVKIDEDAVDKALAELRQRASRLEPVDGRGVEQGDTVTLDLERRLVSQPATTDSNTTGTAPSDAPEQHKGVSVEIGNKVNPPGFDDELLGLKIGATRSFTVTFPEGYEVEALAGAEAAYDIEVMGVHRRVLPDLDDEFAKQTADLKDLTALRARVKEDLTTHAEHEAKNDVRKDLLHQLAGRVTVEVPDILIDHEVERRVEQLARHMLSQRMDPREANIDWDAFRQQQRTAATDTVRSTLVLDAIASREAINISDEDISHEIERQAEASGRTKSAVRALVEKEGGVDRITTGLRREKAIDFLLSRATIVTA